MFLVKKFDMFYYYVCTTQYITDTKQTKKEEKGHNLNSTVHCNCIGFFFFFNSRHLKFSNNSNKN